MNFSSNEYFEDDEIVGGNEFIEPSKPEPCTFTKYVPIENLSDFYEFSKHLDIKNNNVKLKNTTPYISNIKGGNSVNAGDFYDDPNANQNQELETSKLEAEVKGSRQPPVITPLSHALINQTDCADITKKQGEDCMPQHIIQEVLRTNGTKNMEEAKRKTGCDSEKCVAERTNAKLSIFFRQPGPRSTTKWLSNSNLDTVLSSFAAHKPKFLHIPFHMINFAEHPNMTLNNINWPDVAQKYDAAACAVNTDTYERMKGKHWFALYVSFKDKTIEYFDSSSRDRQEINTWMEDTNRKLGGSYTLKKNKVQHQHGATECGVYTLYFIAARLLFNIPFEEFQKNMVNDEYMYIFRKIVFA